MNRTAARLFVLDELIGLLKFWTADQVWSWHDPDERVPQSDRVELDAAAGWLVKGLEGQRARLWERG